MTDKICKHFYVTGKVHGVWFRAGTQQEAEKLGVSGWVRNLADGRVEVVACGSSEQLAQLEAWLLHGPERAEVDDLQVQGLPWQQYQGFEVL
jgi:acylphosphatase